MRVQRRGRSGGDEAPLVDTFHHFSSGSLCAATRALTRADVTVPAHLHTLCVNKRRPHPPTSPHGGLSVVTESGLSGKCRGNDTGHIFTNLPCWRARRRRRACQRPVSSPQPSHSGRGANAARHARPRNSDGEEETGRESLKGWFA